MTIRSVGLIALHSCPLLGLGAGKAGGMSGYVLGLSAELERRGVSTTIITAHHDAPHKTHDSRIVHLSTPAPDSAAAWLDAAPLFAREAAEALGQNCDVIHTHYWASGLAGLEMARIYGIPHVTTFHTIAALKQEALLGFHEDGRLPDEGINASRSPTPPQIDPPERHDAERAIAREADGIMAWTAHERAALVSLFGADPDRITTAPIGVDTERFHPINRDDARRRLGIPRDEETLLYVGRLDPIKGADILLRAAGLLADRPRLHVRILGGDVDPRYSAKLCALACDLGIASRITWGGIMAHDDLPCHYAAADAVIVPSYSESFSMAAAEAMACGKPVIASNVPGPASFIVDGVSGRLAKAGDAAVLAQTIRETLDDAPLMQRLSAGALEAAQQLTWRAGGDAAIHMYEQVLRSKM